MSGVSLEDAIAVGRGVERPFNCPAHLDANASASVNIDKGVWFCYACGATGTVDGDVPKPDAVLRALSGQAPPRTMPEAWLDVYDSLGASPYWAGRVGLATARAFRCGTDPMTGMPTYPIRDLRGRIIGVVRRSDAEGPKYLYPAGVPVSRCLFAAGTGRSVLVLVEGAADVMALHRDGIPSGMTVAGVYGAGVHAPQAEWIAEQEYGLVLLGFDADKAGDAAALRTQEALDVECRRITWPGAKDPGELAEGEAMSVVRGMLDEHPDEKEVVGDV